MILNANHDDHVGDFRGVQRVDTAATAATARVNQATVSGHLGGFASSVPVKVLSALPPIEFIGHLDKLPRHGQYKSFFIAGDERTH